MLWERGVTATEFTAATHRFANKAGRQATADLEHLRAGEIAQESSLVLVLLAPLPGD